MQFIFFESGKVVEGFVGRSVSISRRNLAATFEGFVPANNPNARRDRDLM